MGRKKLSEKDKLTQVNVTIEKAHLKLLKKGKTVSGELRRILDLYISGTQKKIDDFSYEEEE